MLSRIEKRSQELLEKGTAARLVDKKADSGEVASLVDQLREAITHYQVSEKCFFRAERDLRDGVGFATTSDLRTNHQPNCKYIPARLPLRY